MPVSEADRIFIVELLDHELDPDIMDLLDEKLLNSEFKAAYDSALSAKYDNKKGKLKGYLPMIILGVLLVLGLYLIVK